MFDIGFLELVMVGLVALVVLGPEKLPGTIRTVSLWIGRLRRSFNTIKQDIEREIGADEIRRQLRNEEIMEKFNKTKSQVNNTIQSVKQEAEALRKNADLESQVAGLSSQGSKQPATPPDAAAAPQTTTSSQTESSPQTTQAPQTPQKTPSAQTTASAQTTPPAQTNAQPTPEAPTGNPDASTADAATKHDA